MKKSRIREDENGSTFLDIYQYVTVGYVIHPWLVINLPRSPTKVPFHHYIYSATLLGMPLRITSAPVAGIKKNKRSSSRPSPFAGHARTKPSGAPRRLKSDETGGHLDDLGPLPDVGASRYVSETSPVEDVVQALYYIRQNMFEDIPVRAGMNSTRIAEVLNLRRSLPPLASVAHVHTLLDAPTRVEKEIVDLVNSGRVRRLLVPGRGTDAAGLGDCLVLTEDLEALVRESKHLESSMQGGYTTPGYIKLTPADRFLEVLKQIGNTSAIPPGAFPQEECMKLVRGGFLVSSSSLSKGSLQVASLPGLPVPAGTSASRSDAPSQPTPSKFHTATLFLSLPNTGPYLRLLSAGRTHLMSLLKRSSSREVPVYLLRDRWDGAVESEKSFNVAKRVRGEHAGILPGKTKKWKDLYGMKFRWALEEALGAGLIEIFDTGSVGPGVRCL